MPKGQKVHVSISNEGADTSSSGEESMILLIYPDIPQNSIVTDNTHFHASGKYELRVLQTRNDARKTKLKNI